MLEEGLGMRVLGDGEGLVLSLVFGLRGERRGMKASFDGGLGD